MQAHTVGLRFVIVLAAGALLAAGCTSNEEGEPTMTSEPPLIADGEADSDTPEPSPVEEQAPTAASGLDGAIGEAGDLVLGWFNGQTFDERTYQSAFDDSFRDAVGFDLMTPLIDQLRLDGPFEVREIERSTATEADLIVVGASGERARLSIVVAASDDPTMTGLFVGPAVEPSFDEPASLPDAVDRLRNLGITRIGAFDGACLPTAEGPKLAEDEQAPIGSAFKLWVLAAIVEAVGDGTITWDDDVKIRDELDSIPSGITQNDEPGTTITVRELAERMIEISDNTATDHLIDLVGREAVEDALTATGHSAPEQNRPFLTTREFTIVKFSSGELRRQYLAADEAERRRILDDDVSAMPLPPLSNITSVVDPLDVESLEWFASPADLCRVLNVLADDDEATATLVRNPGMPDRSGHWDSILYKGGSEPGVFAMAWLVTDADGNRRVIAGSIANESSLIDEFEAASLLGYIRDATE